MTAKKTAPGLTRVRLGEQIDRVMTDKGIEIEVSDDVVLRVPPPELWGPEVQEFAKDETHSKEEFAAFLVGEDEWAAFVAAGGTIRLFDKIVTEHWDASTGE